MKIQDQVVVVTGAARGIGAAMCSSFSAAGAKAVIAADIDSVVYCTAERFGGIPMICDVASECSIIDLVESVLSRWGRIDLFCSNAGITSKGGLDCLNSDWQRLWDINVMSRVYAARAVVPAMLEAGGGYLVHTASAAGLLTEIGSAGYSVTKHADVALAEWLSVTYGRQGIKVSCVCPLGVETDMLDESDPIHRYLQLQSISADQAAEAVLRGIDSEEFLILPHPQVAEFFQMKASDHDRWLRGMQRLKEKLTSQQRRSA